MGRRRPELMTRAGCGVPSLRCYDLRQVRPSGSLVTPISFRRSAVADAATQAQAQAGARPPRALPLRASTSSVPPPAPCRLGRHAAGPSTYPRRPPALPGPAPLHVCLLLLRRRRRSRAAAPTGESRNSSLDRFGPRQIRSGRGWLPVSIPALGRAARSYCLGVVAVRLVQWLGSAVWWVPVLGAVSQGKLAALARC